MSKQTHKEKANSSQLMIYLGSNARARKTKRVFLGLLSIDKVSKMYSGLYSLFERHS